MSIIMSIIVKNFELFCYNYVFRDSLLLFYQTQVQKESGAEGKEKICDSHEPLRMIL